MSVRTRTSYIMSSRDSLDFPPGSLQTLPADSRSLDATPLSKKNIDIFKWSEEGKKALKEKCKEFERIRKSNGERGREGGGREEGGQREEGGGWAGNCSEEIGVVTRGEGGGGGGGGERGEGGGGGENEVQPFGTKQQKHDDNANYLGLSPNANTTEVASLPGMQIPTQQQQNENDLASERAQAYYCQPREQLPVNQEETAEQMKRDALRQELSKRIQERSSRQYDMRHLQGKEEVQQHDYKQEIDIEYRKHPENILISGKGGQEHTQTLDIAEQKEQALRQGTEMENVYTITELRKTDIGSSRLGCLQLQNIPARGGPNSCDDEEETKEGKTDDESPVSLGDNDNQTTTTSRLACHPQDDEETTVMLYCNNNNYPDTKLQLDEEDLHENLLGNHGDGNIELGVKSLSTSTLNTKDGRSSDGEPRASCSFPHAGILLAIASSLCFSVGSALVKVLHGMDPMELVVFRFLLMWIFNLPLLFHSRQHPLPKGHRLRLLLRGLAGSFAVMCHFYAFRHMPIADAGTITFTSPIIVLLFSWVLLKEPCDVFNVVLVLVTLSGIVCIAKPAFIFTSVEVPQKSEQELWGLIACLGGVVGQACVYIILRLLKDVHYVVVLNMFCAVAVATTSCVALASTGTLSLPSLRQVGFILILGFSSFAEQVFLTKAVQVEHASTVSIARMSSVLFGFLLQILLFGHYPDAFSIGGALMVSSCVVLLGVKTWWQTRKEAEKMEKE